MVRIYPDTGHWMNRKDREGLEWMKQFQRNTWPSRVEWFQDDVTHNRFYWLEIPDGLESVGQRISAWVTGQTVHIEIKDLDRLNLRLSDNLLDLDQPISVFVNGHETFQGKVQRSIRAIQESLMDRADPKSVATCVLSLRR